MEKRYLGRVARRLNPHPATRQAATTPRRFAAASAQLNERPPAASHNWHVSISKP